MRRPLNLAGQSMGTLADLSFSSSSSDDDDDDRLFEGPEMDAVVGEQSTVQEVPVPAPVLQRLPPDSPQLLIFILLWVMAVGFLIIGKAIPHIDLPNQASHATYQKQLKVWTRQGYPIFNSTIVIVDTNHSRVTLKAVDQPSSLKHYNTLFFTGTAEYQLNAGQVFHGVDKQTSVLLIHPNATNELQWPLEVVRAKPVKGVANARDCAHGKAHWINNTCSRFEALAAVSAVVSLTDKGWCWADRGDSQANGCRQAAHGNMTEQIYKAVDVGVNGTAVIDTTVVIRHTLDPHLLAVGLRFNLTTEEKQSVGHNTEVFSYVTATGAVASSVLLIVVRCVKSHDF